MAKNINVYFDDGLPNGMRYFYEDFRWSLDLKYANNKLNENLSLMFYSEKNAQEILDRISRRFYDYIYSEKFKPA